MSANKMESIIKGNEKPCMACLGVGKELHNVDDPRMEQFYLDALREIPLCITPTSCPSICWECWLQLQKAVAFREKVKDLYKLLHGYNNENVVADEPKAPLLHNDTKDLEPIIKTLEEEKPHAEDVFYILKVENDWDDVDTADHLKSDCDNPREMDIEETCTKKTKRGIKSVDKKVKKAKKIIKRMETDKKSTKRKTLMNEVLTIDLSYDEMMLERLKESKKKGFLDAKYKCQSCLLRFSYSKSFKAHLDSKHSQDIGDYSCPICKTIISSVDSFTAHYKRHMRRYECNICQKRTIDLKVMQQHFYSKHAISLKEYKCKVCGKISNSIDNHRYHRDTHKARVQCPDCDKTFSHRAGLMNHRLSVHESRNKFPCVMCGKIFRWKTSLKRHEETLHNKEQSIGMRAAAYCEPCKVEFRSVSSYQRHLKNSLKHVTQDELRFICDHCNRRFADKTKIRDHIETKHLHTTYQCTICLKPSRNRVSLDQHVRNVHKGRPHDKMCHYCGKGFPTKMQLESHIRTHTGERPFICELCPTRFSQHSNLYKHYRQVHLNIKSKRNSALSKKRKDGTATDVPLVNGELTPTEPFKASAVVQWSSDNVNNIKVDIGLL